MSILRGVLFNIGYGLSVLLYGIFYFFMGKHYSSTQSYRFANSWVTFMEWWLKITCGITYTVEGLEHLPDTPGVVVANHQSTWETFFLQRYFSPQSTVLKKELMQIPFFGYIVRSTKPIVIDRNQPTQALKQILRQGAERLKEGNWVLIFPEGTRVPVGETRPHFSGGSMLAINNNVPIVPLVHNAGKCWPRDTIRKYPGVITIKFGAPIDTEGRKPKELTQDIRQWIDREKASL